MLEADLAARVRVAFAVVGARHAVPAEAKLKDAGDVQLADGGYAKIEFPLIDSTPDLPAIAGAFHDPEFARASFERLESLDAMTMDEYLSLAKDLRSKAFSISGETNVELIGQVKDALAETVKAGGTPADFQKAVDAAFADFGVDSISPWRTRTIFDANLRNAQSEAEWEELHSEGVAEAFPFFRYRTFDDVTSVRPNHWWMRNRVYASDDPVWEEWWPPNGFNCRCWIDTISRSEAESQKIVADTQRPEQFGIHPDDGWGAGEK